MAVVARIAITFSLALVSLLFINLPLHAAPSEAQLAKWLERFPDADTNGDGKLSIAEAVAYRDKLQGQATDNRKGNTQVAEKSGQPTQRDPRLGPKINVDPRWAKGLFPEDSVCHMAPRAIAQLYDKLTKGREQAVISYRKPADGSLRIVGTGHSFMMPGYRTMPAIVKAAGFNQPTPVLHTGGGVTGSTRYKWEQENGIFAFEGRPRPKLLSSIANAKWDAMVWGPFFDDKPVYYTCWIEFCLKHSPGMKFYLSDAWPQLLHFGERPKSEAEMTNAKFDEIARTKRAYYVDFLKPLNAVAAQRKQAAGQNGAGKHVFIIPTSDAMILAVKAFRRGELPGVHGIHRLVGGKARSIWMDQIGHIGPGFDRLEGYVFYATLYKRSPALIKGDIPFGNRGRWNAGAKGFPSKAEDKLFREIAWQAVTGHPLSGVVDKDNNGIGDDIE